MISLALTVLLAQGIINPYQFGASGGGGENGLLTGLVAHYTFDEAANTDPAEDSTANNLDLSDHNDPAVASGILDGARKSAATPAGFESTDAAFDMTGDQSFSLWVKWSDLSGFHNVASKFWDSGKGWRLTKGTSTSIRFRASVDGSTETVDIDSGITPTVGVWYHLAWTRSGDNFAFYVTPASAGALAAAGTDIQAGSIASTAPLDVGYGHGSNTTGSRVSGLIADVDEMGVWSVGLTQSQVEALYNEGTPLPYASYE